MSNQGTITDQVGAVVIGRNEGPRLDVCLGSLATLGQQTVYVDSGSTDNSLEIAARHGVEIVQLDMSIPFTAARARNAGLEALRRTSPGIAFVQFVDGDCEIAEGWLETAWRKLQEDEELCAVCGRLRERYPEKSVYNYLCDLEWDTPVGPLLWFGGIVLARISALEQVGGFRDDLIAGEEPELGVRLRARNWQIERLDAEMGLHDADITRFNQWWRRTERAGYAYVLGASIHGRAPERHFVRHTIRALIWGGGIPFIFLILSFVSPYSLLGFVIYPAQIARLWRRSNSFAVAFFSTLGKFPEMQGIVSFTWDMMRRSRRGIIEYK